MIWLNLFILILGYEFSGEILQVGPHVKDLHKGDKVIGLNKDNFSAMATECVSESRVRLYMEYHIVCV